MRRFLLGFLLFISACGWSWAGSGVSTLTGMVVTGINPERGNEVGRGDPLSGVEIEVQGMEFRAVTSANGFFSFEDLPDGEYRLVARKPGYADVTQRVKVNYVGMASRCQILMNPHHSTNIDNMSVLPGDLFVAYSRKPDNVNDMESSPFKNIWQMALAAGAPIRVRPEDLPHQPTSWGQSYLMNPITSAENCLMVFPYSNPSRSGFLATQVKPYWLCFNQNGSLLYVAGGGSVLEVLDARRSYKLLRRMPMGGVVTDLRLTKDGRYLSACLMGGKPGVVLLDAATAAPAGFVPTDTSPWSACLVGNRVFACMGDGRRGEVVALDAQTGLEVGRCKVGHCPTAIEGTPDGKRLLVACSKNACVSVVDSTTVQEIGRIGVEVEPQKLAVSPDGSRCLVSNRVSNTVSVVDLKSSQVVATVEVGKAPLGICYGRGGRLAYVGCRDSGVIMVLDGKSGQVLHTTIPLPHAVPTGLAILP